MMIVTIARGSNSVYDSFSIKALAAIPLTLGAAMAVADSRESCRRLRIATAVIRRRTRSVTSFIVYALHEAGPRDKHDRLFGSLGQGRAFGRADLSQLGEVH